jgi:hypothetical protein
MIPTVGQRAWFDTAVEIFLGTIFLVALKTSLGNKKLQVLE